MNDKTYLDKVYAVDGMEQTRLFYDEWAESYDAEILANGYITPVRIARALGAQLKSYDRPVLDFGCGTGLSGAALIQAGFTVVDGADLSADMLAEAREKGVYRDLWQVHEESELPFAPGAYCAITAAGVIGAGAAPAEVLDQLLDRLDTRGLLAFSFNDHTLAEPDFESRLHRWVEDGRAHVIFQEYGPRLPEIDLGATVYVVEKA